MDESLETNLIKINTIKMKMDKLHKPEMSEYNTCEREVLLYKKFKQSKVTDPYQKKKENENKAKVIAVIMAIICLALCILIFYALSFIMPDKVVGILSWFFCTLPPYATYHIVKEIFKDIFASKVDPNFLPEQFKNAKDYSDASDSYWYLHNIYKKELDKQNNTKNISAVTQITAKTEQKTTVAHNPTVVTAPLSRLQEQQLINPLLTSIRSDNEMTSETKQVYNEKKQHSIVENLPQINYDNDIFVDNDMKKWESISNLYPYVKVPNKKTAIKYPIKGKCSRKGIVEESFCKDSLSVYFTEFIYDNLTVFMGDTSCEPDIALIDSRKKLYIDIEIDEPYDGINRNPIHYMERGKSIDESRNKGFTDRGWLVVRFSEKQIKEQPKQCCRYIYDIVKQITDISIPDLDKVASIVKEKMWTKEEAIQMAKNNIREKYLGISQFKQQKELPLKYPIEDYVGAERIENKLFIQLKSPILQPIKKRVEITASIESITQTQTKSEKPIVEGVVINGIKWANYNLGDRATFVSKSEDFGIYCSCNPACPQGYRLPANFEIDTLLDTSKVTSEWITQNGINGRKFTDIATGNTLFLPAAGYSRSYYNVNANVNVNVNAKHTYGGYWCSKENGGSNYLFFDSRTVSTGIDTTYKRSVRCVAE